MDGPYPETLIDTYAGKRLVIVAGGRCVWDDLALLGVSGGDNGGWDVMCVNDIVMHYPGRVEHFYSNDDRWIPKWVAARRELISRAWGEPANIHTCKRGHATVWPWPGHGTSSLNAVYTGIALGYKRIVLCGAPLDNSGHYFDPPWVKSNFEREVGLREDGQMMYWEGAKRKWFNDKVRSMSGRTREVLGAGP